MFLIRTKRFFVYALCFFAWLYTDFNNAQMVDMSSIEGLTGAISNRPQEVSDTDEAIKNNEPQALKQIDPDVFEVDNYGFSGRESFIFKPLPKNQETALRYFGYEFFSNTPTSFAQVDYIPTPQNYILGPGDNIKIALFGTTNKQFSLEISTEGEIYFPDMGPILVSGMSFVDMKNDIQNRISSQFIGTQSSITMGKLRTIKVFVLGEVFQPGMYTVSSLSTLTNALLASGGVKNTGSLRKIQLKRGGQVVTNFDFYDLLLKGDITSDKTLQPNDVVFIPPITKTVAIKGEILRPGIYELRNNESMNDLIEYAGGFKPKADLTAIDIQRIDDTKKGYKLLSSNIQESTNSTNNDLKNGDMVQVYPVSDSMNSAILIKGHAIAPGFYSWKEGMTISSLFQTIDDFLPMTDLNYILIKSNDVGGGIKLRQIDMEDYLKQSTNRKDILLNNRDEIIFFPKMLSLEAITSELIEFKELSEEQKNYFLKQTETIRTYDLDGSLKQERINPIPEVGQPRDIDKIENDKFYRYKVYQYCELPNNVAKTIVESGLIGSFVNNIGIESSDDPLKLDTVIRAGTEARDKVITSEEQLTLICRNQLLKETIDQLRSDTSLSPKKTVRITGNVLFPGDYPVTMEMKLSDVIKASGGFNQNTYTSELELMRVDISDPRRLRDIEFFEVDKSILDSVEIKADDVINVKKSPTLSENITVSGSVLLPGGYPLSRDTTLSAVLKRAGGVLKDGDLTGAIFQRQSLKVAQTQRLADAKSEIMRNVLLASQEDAFTNSDSDSSQYLDTLAKVLSVEIDPSSLGRVIIDLSAIISGEKEDIVLESGDTLFIPKRKTTVSVIGEVFSPTMHLHDQRLSISDYLDDSGGLTDFADKNGIYIIKSDGSIISSDQVSGGGFFRGSSNNLSPGDTIVVPIASPRIGLRSGLRATSDITSIIYQMALAAAAVNSF